MQYADIVDSVLKEYISVTIGILRCVIYDKINTFSPCADQDYALVSNDEATISDVAKIIGKNEILLIS